MINESKKADSRQWEKWEKSGAVSTPPQVIERREKEAQRWLQDYYDFDLSRVPHDKKQKAFEEVESFYKINKTPESDKRDVLELIEAHPILTQEQVSSQEYRRFGLTNNFWNAFFPATAEGIRQRLQKGEMPHSSMFGADVLYWQNRHLLMPAFEHVGFERIKRMHEAIATFLRLDREWKRRLGESERGLWYGIGAIPKSPLIPDEEKQRYIQSTVEYTNTLRLLAIELTKEGIPFSSLHR